MVCLSLARAGNEGLAAGVLVLEQVPLGAVAFHHPFGHWPFGDWPFGDWPFGDWPFGDWPFGDWPFGDWKTQGHGTFLPGLHEAAEALGGVVPVEQNSSALLETWLPHLQHRVELGTMRPTTANFYRAHVGNYVLPHLGSVRMRARAIESGPKTDKPRRSIAIAPEVLEALKTTRRRQLEDRMAWGPAWVDSGGLILTQENGDRLRPDAVSPALCEGRQRRWPSARQLSFAPPPACDDGPSGRC